MNLDRFTGLPQWPLRSHGGKGVDRIMKSLLKLKPASMILIAALAFWAPAASASLVIFGDGQWGDFTGSITYHAADASHATLQVLLHNSSPLENGGFLTGFALNNPDNLISTVTAFQSTNPNFKLLGGPGFQDGINGAPYGQFDLGASTFKSLEGGGKPSKGLAVGATETFTFTLAGSLLLSLDEWSFVQELSVGPGIGEGAQFMVARFRGFDNGASNKTAGHAVPLPGTLALLGSGLAGLAFYRRRANLKG